MARRRDRELASSLFPFLSVLACVIGTLTLMIAALAMNQVVSDLESQLEEDPSLGPELVAEQAAIRALARELESAEDLEAELAAAAAALRSMGIRPDASDAQRRQAVAARLAAARSARQLAALEKKARELDISIEGVRTREVKAARPTRDDRTIRIHPRGKGEDLRPFFVECRADGLRIFFQDLDDSMFLDWREQRFRAQLRKYLQGARAVRKHTVIFLIRPDGVQTYEKVMDEMRNIYVRHAKLPLPGDGELEFAL